MHRSSLETWPRHLEYLSHERGVESCRFLRLALQNYRTTKTTDLFANRLQLPLKRLTLLL